MTDRFVCIHGHFYQPPRENPWLEVIERQPSARPYHDWNERIAAECYAPNAEARLLDGRGRLVGVVDNYSRISFNLGPTLATWLERHRAALYRAIQRADVRSRERFSGHGGAIAQAYGHAILPLASARDRRTQVLWGVADFRHRFGREPEGMWLPETAVDVDTLEALAAAGLRFTILAPHQAARVRALGVEAWRDVAGGAVDPTRAYAARLPSGRPLALFFYDGPLSRAIAFDGLLHSGDRFADRLLAAMPERSGGRLVHVATDGESYGHHHRHGEMALAAALARLEARGDVRVTTYGEFLALHPPEEEVEIVENSSWSCAHGVERWRSDCGCHAGGGPGWTQAWRAPLRAALDDLAQRAGEVFERLGAELLVDPWRARDRAIELVLDRSEAAVERFFAAESRSGLTRDERGRALRLLEMQRQALAMFASCGWFFSDLGGIETRQVLLHAARVAELAHGLTGQPFEAPLLAALEAARSNESEVGSGRAVYLASVGAARVAPSTVAAQDAIGALFDGRPDRDRIHSWEVERRVGARLGAGSQRFLLAEVDVHSHATLESSTYCYAAFAWGDPNVQVGVRPGGLEGGDFELGEVEEALRVGDPARIVRFVDRRFPIHCSLEALFRDDRERLLTQLLAGPLAEVEGRGKELFERHAPLMRRFAAVGLPLPGALRNAAEMALLSDLKRAAADPQADLGQILTRLAEVAGWGLDLDREEIAYSFEPAMAELGARLLADPLDADAALRLERLLDLAGALPFGLDLWPPQSALYRLFAERSDRFDGAERDRAAEVERLIRLADRLGVAVD